MPLETGSFVDDLTPTNPPGSDPAGQGDDHIRLIKTCVKGTFPNMGGIFGQSRVMGTSQTLSAAYNTSQIIVSASITLTTPPSASITAGWGVDIQTIGSVVATIAAQGAQSINGSATLAIPGNSSGRVYYQGSDFWRVSYWPSGSGVAGFEDLRVGGTLSVSGATALNALTVNGIASLSGAAVLGSTLSVSGATALAALTVNGIATFSAAVHMKSTLSISGAVTMASTLTVSGAAVLGALTVNGIASLSGAAVLGSTLSVSGATALAALTVNGVATFSAAVHMKSTLSVSGAVALGTTLGVTGQSSLAGLTVAGTSTLSGTVILSNGQLKFPASQNASSDANTLDDYEEGTFTPSLTFATPGDLTVVYSTRVGRYTKIGETVTVNFRMVTTTWTHTTASGASLITGLPFSTPASPTDISYVLSTGVTTGPQPGTNWSLPGLVIGANASSAALFLSNLASGSSIAMTPPNMPSGTQMEVSAGGTYQV